METNLYKVLALIKEGMDSKELKIAEDVGRHLGEKNKQKAVLRGIRRMGALYKTELVERLYPKQHNEKFEKVNEHNVVRYFLTEKGLRTLAMAPQ